MEYNKRRSGAAHLKEKNKVKQQTHAKRQDIKQQNVKRQNTKQQSAKTEIAGQKKAHGQACPYEKRCGGCQYSGLPYRQQLAQKQEELHKLLGRFAKVEPIIGMENPYHYRHKVNAAFGYVKGKVISGVYEEHSHRLVQVDQCLIEHEKADEIIVTVRNLLQDFKIRVYDARTDLGLLKHVMVRVAHGTGQIMVILILRSPILPSKNNFVKALLKQHPQITTVVLNVNDKRTTMVLGKRDIVLYGKGYIEDVLCGLTFKLSPQSFYQVNPVQTELLYDKAVEFAQLTGQETVLDAYCGIGTIGLAAAKKAKSVLGIEYNPEAVKDARENAKRNGVSHAEFVEGDAGVYMTGMAEQGKKADVVFLDPPRSGSDEAFLSALCRLSPERVVYVSCAPDTLARDLMYLTKHGYRVERIQPVDMFPMTVHVETIVLMSRD